VALLLLELAPAARVDFLCAELSGSPLRSPVAVELALLLNPLVAHCVLIVSCLTLSFVTNLINLDRHSCRVLHPRHVREAVVALPSFISM
jgi:hypothetical protein